MFHKILFTIAWLITAFNAGLALKCYTCAGTKTSDCGLGKVSSMVTQFCPNTSSVIDNKSWYKTYSYDLNDIKDSSVQVVCLNLLVSGYQPELVSRSCGVVPANTDPCEFFKQFKQIKDCRSCKTDLCNKGDDEYNPVISVII